MITGENAKEVTVKGKFVGYYMSSYPCAEHECGITPMKQAFDVKELTEATVGLESRRIVRFRDFAFQQGVDKACLIFGVENPEYYLKNHYENPREEVVCGWDDSGFGIFVNGKTQTKNLVSFLENLKNGDAFYYIGEIAGTDGFHFLNSKDMDKTFINKLKEKDNDKLKLKKLDGETGVRELIDSVNRRFNKTNRGVSCFYYALRASLLTQEEIDNKHTKYDVIYWLNPQDQKKHSAGWFTVEELQKWANGMGPVIRKDIFNAVRF